MMSQMNVVSNEVVSNELVSIVCRPVDGFKDLGVHNRFLGGQFFLFYCV